MWLVIDDSEVWFQAMKRWLPKSLRLATSIAEGATLAAQLSPQAILLDRRIGDDDALKSIRHIVSIRNILSVDIA